MKKTLSLLLALTMVLCLFAGCGNSAAPAASSNAASSAEEASAPAEEAPAPAEDAPAAPAEEAPAEASAEDNAIVEAGTSLPDVELPLTEEPVTFSLFTGMMPPAMDFIDSMEQCLVYEELEARTGIHISIEPVHPSTQNEKFNLMVASNDFTDLMNDVGSQYAGGINKALADEVIVDLTDMVKELAPHYYATITADETVYRDTTTDDGSILQFYNVFPNEQASWMGPMIRQDWLNELGLESPTTYDEYETVLRAFKDNYNATLWIPAYGVTGNNWLTGGYGVAAYFASNSSSLASTFYAVDGQIKCGLIEEGFLDYLDMMSRWYAEGLIYPDYISGDAAEMNCARDAVSLINNGTVGMWHAETVDMSTYEGVEAAAVSYPTINKGDTIHVGYYNAKLNAAYFAVSSACADPELAVQWVNYGFTEEGNLLNNWGIEGMTFEYDENGNPYFTELITNNPDGMPQHVAMFVYVRDSAPFVLDRYRTTYTYTEAQQAAEGIWTANYDAAYTISTAISLNEDESSKMAGYCGDLMTYASQMINQFITGVVPMSEFDNYVAQMKAIGIEECIAIEQDAYERYMAKTLD